MLGGNWSHDEELSAGLVWISDEQVADPFTGLFPLLDGYIDEHLSGDVFLLAPAAVGDSFQCDDGTPTSNPAPDVSGVVGRRSTEPPPP